MAVSDRVKTGPEKAPHRSLWKALGLTDEELTRPLIGVVCAQSECVPGHNHLKNIAQAVKDGVRLAISTGEQRVYANILLTVGVA